MKGNEKPALRAELTRYSIKGFRLWIIEIEYILYGYNQRGDLMMFGYKKIATVCLGLTVLLTACAETSEPDDNEENIEEPEPVSVEEFTDAFLAGEFETIYEQMSDSFQANVSFEEFVDHGEEFNQDVSEYEPASEMPLNDVMEYQWIDSEETKGIRSYWSNDSIEGLQLMQLNDYPEADENFTDNTYTMPVTGTWFTFWGGTNDLLNYHYPSESQRYAYDLLIREDDKSYEGDPDENESYFAFGEDVVAPADGEVVSVEYNIRDNTPGVETNEDEPLGNHVIIDHGNGEYGVIGHFKQESVEVSEGDSVEAGDFLGLAGNSGNSSEPHVHFHVADSPDWEHAASIRIQFEDDIDPVRGDEVSGF